MGEQASENNSMARVRIDVAFLDPWWGQLMTTAQGEGGAIQGPMDDYYSYRPRVKLDRPVVIVGFAGCRPMQTARVAAMLTGLETVMLPHQVTHHLTRHPEALLLQGEHELLHDAELLLLTKAAQKRSPPLIAMGFTTLQDPRCAGWVAQHALLVHLRQTLEEAVRSIAAERATDPRKHQHLQLAGGWDEVALAPLHATSTARFDRMAGVRIDVAGRAPLEVGRTIPEVLGWDVA